MFKNDLSSNEPDSYKTVEKELGNKFDNTSMKCPASMFLKLLSILCLHNRYTLRRQDLQETSNKRPLMMRTQLTYYRSLQRLVIKNDIKMKMR